MKNILIGNSFPMSLVSKKITIEPISLNDVQSQVNNSIVHSFWGHKNTQKIVEKMLNCSLGDDSRKAVELDCNGLPRFNNVIFNEIYILTPKYRVGFRPILGEEVQPNDMVEWNCLKVIF